MDPLLGPIEGAEHQKIGGLSVDLVRAGNCRIKRIVYPAGFRWSTHMKPVARTELCMHAHIGFLARGEIAGQYHDGCTFGARAPQVIVIEPGHDAWVVGDGPAVLIQVDSEEGTARRFGIPPEHSH